MWSVWKPANRAEFKLSTRLWEVVQGADRLLNDKNNNKT